MMKKLYLVFILLPILVVAQQDKSIIKVSGYAVHDDPTPSFKAMVSLSGNYSSFPSDVVKFEDLKKQYREALEKAGIPWEALKENPNDFGYETLYYEKEGTLFAYTTTSAKEMKKFLSIKTFGLERLRNFAQFTIDNEELKLLSAKAITNAKEKATAIADAMGKKLGPIQQVEDLNNKWGEVVETSLYYDIPTAEYKYYIHVTFSVD